MNQQKTQMLAALKQVYAGEALFRPSNAARWMTCPGSVQLIAQIPKESRNIAGAAAKEGTGAHALAETVLKSWGTLAGRKSPEDFIGQRIPIHLGPEDPASDPWVTVDAEMAEKIKGYEDLISGYMATPGSEMFIERRLSLKHLDPTNPLFAEVRGTGDVVVINRVERWIVVLDLKYGKGVPVSRDSPQPKLYVLAALLEFQQPGRPWQWVGTTIYQPRLPYPAYSEEDWIKPFVYMQGNNPDGVAPLDDLYGRFLPDVVEAMEAALEVNPKFAPSKSACQWCPSRLRVYPEPGSCIALQAAALSIGYDPFDARLQQLMKVGEVPSFEMAKPGEPLPAPRQDVLVLPDIAGLDVGQVSAILNGRALLKLWLSGVEHRASQLLMAGARIPNYSLEQRSKHRQWAKPPDEIARVFREAGVKTAQMYSDPKLVTPAAMEKLVSSTQKGMLQPDFGLVIKPLGEYQLVARSGNMLEGPGEVEITEI